MNDFADDIVSLYRENQWQKILELRAQTDDITARKLLWVWPTIKNLNFMKNAVIALNLKGVISIGCGCGLFEWILQQSSGLPVLGYEINEEWWRSKYSNPQFIPLEFPNGLNVRLNPKYALLFCYFNNGAAFLDYIRRYDGNLVFIAGPGRGVGRHTDPEPFGPNFGDGEHWTLLKYEEVSDTKDFIAAYVRNGTINNGHVLCEFIE